MKVKYDRASDIVYFEFRDVTVTTKRITEDIAVDYDAEGRVAGVEVLEAKKNIFGKTPDFSVQIEGLMQKA